FVPGSARTEWAPDVESPNQTPQVGPSAQATPTPGATRNPGEETGNNNPDSGGLSLHVNIWYVVAVAAVLALVVLLLAPARRRRAARGRGRAQRGRVTALPPARRGQEDRATAPAAMSAAQRDAHNAWAELLDTMIDYGVLVDPAETPRATAGRLASTPEL